MQETVRSLPGLLMGTLA